MGSKYRGKAIIRIFIFMIIFFCGLLHFRAVPVQAASKAVPKLSASQKKLALDQTCELTLKNTGGIVIWETSDTSVITIKGTEKNKAKLTAVGKGKAVILAHIKGNSRVFKCKVSVYDPVKLSSSAVSVSIGKTKTLKITGTKSSIQWATSNSKVAVVKQISCYSVQIIAKESGTTYVTAQVGKRYYRCKVTVPERKLLIAIAQSGSYETSCAQQVVRSLGASAVVLKADCDISAYDGLVLPGGTDINPKLYNQKNVASKSINNRLDTLQYKLLDRFVMAGKPVLGICRGLQMINVYFGGSLHQNIKNHRGITHKTVIEKETRLYSVFGSSLRVNSYHHQAVNRLGKGLKVTQRASDRTVEAVEHETLPIYGVQWHPELMGSTGKKLFKDFLGLCRKYRNI